MAQKLYQHYQQLIHEYGDPFKYWPQWCATNKSNEEREKIIIGMILVQRTSWHNADIVLKNLKKANLLSIERIAKLRDITQLTQLTRPAGFYQSKPKRLFDVCRFIIDQGGVEKLIKEDVGNIRQQLLNIKGIGQESADTILLYAFDKPVFIVFIIDEYTRRWTEENGLTSEKDYCNLQKFFHNNLEANSLLYQNFHALIIISQRGRDKSIMDVV